VYEVSWGQKVKEIFLGEVGDTFLEISQFFHLPHQP